jgi:hypothetical protein
MSVRVPRLPPVVLDGRDLPEPAAGRWIPDGPLPSVFEFARACGLVAQLNGAAGTRRAARVAAVLYLGGRIFAEPGRGDPRFGVLLRARGRATSGRYDIAIAGSDMAPLRGVPVEKVPAALAQALGGTLYFMVG